MPYNKVAGLLKGKSSWLGMNEKLSSYEMALVTCYKTGPDKET